MMRIERVLKLIAGLRSHRVIAYFTAHQNRPICRVNMLYYDFEFENGEQDRDNAVTVLFKTNVSGIAWKQKILLSSEAVKYFFFM